MDDDEKIKCIKIVKQKIVDVLESGVFKDPRQEYEFIEEGLYKILVFDDKKINKIILEYFDDQIILNKKIDELTFKKRIEENQNEIQKLMNEYGENVKNIYEMVKKL